MLGREGFLGLAFDLALQDGELGAQVVLLRGELGDRQGEQSLGPATGETLGPGIDGGNGEKRDEGCRHKPQREDHDAFNHADANSKRPDR